MPDEPATPVPDGDSDLDDGTAVAAEEPEAGPGHPLRAQDVPALLPKELG
jgi:hypothetical protein